MIRIDEGKCNRCGLCVKDCISGVFRLEDGRPLPLHPELCNRCSHCVAVCPKQAVVHGGLGALPTAKVQRRLLQPRAYREIALSRRSVRHYRQDPVPREVLEEILDMARYSPTASNMQNVHYTVVTDRALLEGVSRRIFGVADKINEVFSRKPVQLLSRRLLQNAGIVKTLERYARVWEFYKGQMLEGRDLLFHGAPVLFLIHAPKRQNMASDNCLIAATNIANYAHALGLGTCFIGFLVWAMLLDRSLHGRFRIPAGHRVHAALILGTPAIRYGFHAVRKPASVQWI